MLEEQKIDKRTKEYKTQNITASRAKIEALKESGIPLKMAVFHRAIRSFDGTPETAFYSGEAKKSRIALMWLTPDILLCEQQGGHYKLIPTANVSDTIVL